MPGPGLRRSDLMLAVGALLAALALQAFLVPNRLIDGGLTGAAMLLALTLGLPLGPLIVALNLPLLYVGWRFMGRPFALRTAAAVVALGAFTLALRHLPPATGDRTLAAVFGGAGMGLGVGLVLRHGGALDGSEVAALVLARRLGLSVGEWVLGFNLVLMAVAGPLLGWDQALYSLLAYGAATRAMDMALEGLGGLRSVLIVTSEPDNVARAIVVRLGLGVTRLAGGGGYGSPVGILLCVLSRLELPRLRALVRELDPRAFLAIWPVHEAQGGRPRRGGGGGAV